jgi:hypothetical protein
MAVRLGVHSNLNGVAINENYCDLDVTWFIVAFLRFRAAAIPPTYRPMPPLPSPSRTRATVQGRSVLSVVSLVIDCSFGTVDQERWRTAVAAAVALSQDCEASQRLVKRLRAAQLSRISEFGHHSTAEGGYHRLCLLC